MRVAIYIITWYWSDQKAEKFLYQDGRVVKIKFPWKIPPGPKSSSAPTLSPPATRRYFKTLWLANGVPHNTGPNQSAAEKGSLSTVAFWQREQWKWKEWDCQYLIWQLFLTKWLPHFYQKYGRDPSEINLELELHKRRASPEKINGELCV